MLANPPGRLEIRPMTIELEEQGALPSTQAAVVSASKITRRYGEGDAAVDALREVSIDFQRGTFSAVMGPSGSGKSTLMHILAGLDTPTTGTVEIDGVNISTLGDKALTLLRREKIGFIFQFFNLLPMLTAEENIVLPLKIGGTEIDKSFIDELIRTVGLQDRTTHRPAELSGGQQQRVAIARALATRPAVIFADEPTGNLDSTTSADVLHLLRHAVDALGQTIVMVTHEPTAAAAADRVVFLADGRVVRDQRAGTVEELLDVLKELS
jgi:putative ABC transport system ATP-binding protein